MITIAKMKAKPTVSAQKMADDLVAGNPVDAAPAAGAQTFELELKLTGTLDEIRVVVDFMKSQAAPSSPSRETQTNA